MAKSTKANSSATEAIKKSQEQKDSSSSEKIHLGEKAKELITNFTLNHNFLHTKVDFNTKKLFEASTLLDLNNFGKIDLNKFTTFPSSIDNQLNLSDQINELRRKLKKTIDELDAANAGAQSKIDEIESLKTQLVAKEKINHILPRISDKAKDLLFESEEFQNLFADSSKCDSVVLSIDIRRSTELMLKARTPELFSKFITELSRKLAHVIISNFGIFDKFTGDGILAFFPKFYSGEEAIIRAVKAASICHFVFTEHYNSSRECFNVFIKDVGLGIGVDYGNVTLVNTQSELTVVGIPVVYACRFSGARAGETLLNQPAKEELLRLRPTMSSISEAELLIKNEGIAVAYTVTLNEAAFEMPEPAWIKKED